MLCGFSYIRFFYKECYVKKGANIAFGEILYIKL